jgi:site-specific recombinase XerD
LTQEELRALLDAPNRSTLSGVRDRAMLHLAFAAGLRVSELIGLRIDGLDQATLATVHVMGKGRRERVLPLWKETVTTIKLKLDSQRYAIRFCSSLFKGLAVRDGGSTSGASLIAVPRRIAGAELCAGIMDYC